MKKWLFVFAFFCLLALVIVVQDTFGLFETNTSGTQKLEVAKWKIYLNGEDISLTNSITLNDFNYTNPEHVEDGYFAPGSSAEYEIEIDASETDVAVDYDIDVDTSSIEEYPNISFQIVDLDTNQVSNDNHFTGIMNLADTNRKKNLKLLLNWEDDSDYDLNDTKLVGQQIEFVINVHFEQHI